MMNIGSCRSTWHNILTQATSFLEVTGYGNFDGKHRAKGKGEEQESSTYWVKQREVVLMLFIFKKNERSDLSKDQLKILKTIAAKELS